MQPTMHSIRALDYFTVAVVTVVGLLALRVQSQLAPRVNLPGTTPTTTLTGVYVPYNESQYLDVETTFQAFLGIPFAEPPVGDLRFKNPVKKGALGRNYFALADKSICPQLSPIDELLPVVGRDLDEDCLYLGVYTPSPPPTNAPVMVWLHGGGYTILSGSSTAFEPLPLLGLSPDIVVVTVNYRLGVYGFLTTGDSASPGNYGMLDQVMALEWVQDNIAAFGGDPNQVTIMGESAGAGSVGLHLVSPLSDGLFNQAIMESGNALCPWAVDTNMDRQIGFTNEIADMLNCLKSDNEAMIECLRSINETQLTRAQVTLTLKYLYNELLFTPVVDNNFLPDVPMEIINRQEFHSVPTLMGTNEDEGTLIALRAYPLYVLRRVPPTMTLDEFRELLPFYLYYNTPEIVSAVEHWYIDWTKADNSSANQLDAFINVNTDEMFACPTEVMARALEGSGAPVYRYEMTHDPNWSIFLGLPKWLGAGHGEEMQYVFAWALNPSTGLSRLVQQTDEEIRMSVQFMRYWTNFIKTGNPNGPLSTGEYPDWPRYTLPEQEYKMLSLTMENGRAMRMDACAFWLNYIPALYNHTGNSGDLYQEWQHDYEQWRDVHMVDWNVAFEEYKENGEC